MEMTLVLWFVSFMWCSIWLVLHLMHEGAVNLAHHGKRKGWTYALGYSAVLISLHLTIYMAAYGTIMGRYLQWWEIP